MFKASIGLRALFLSMLVLAGSYPAQSLYAQPAVATPESAAAFVGDWTLALEGPNGPGTFTLTVKVTEGKVTGEISSETQARQAITDITKSDTSLLLRYSFDYQGTPVAALVTLKPEGDKIGASIDFADGAYVMTGTATKKA
jgi:hypothetical protein